MKKMEWYMDHLQCCEECDSATTLQVPYIYCYLRTFVIFTMDVFLSVHADNALALHLGPAQGCWADTNCFLVEGTQESSEWLLCGIVLNSSGAHTAAECPS